MYLSWESIQANAISFAKRWEDATSEEAQAQSFTIDFLRVFGIDDPEKIGNFEYKVPLDDGHVGYIDYFWKKKIAIEMKSFGKDLRKAYRQLKSVFGNFSFYSYKKACGQKKTVRGSKNSRRLSNGTPAI